MITCEICKEEMQRDEMLFHLENDHGLEEDDLSILEERREIRRRDTDELLATWKEIVE